MESPRDMADLIQLLVPGSVDKDPIGVVDDLLAELQIQNASELIEIAYAVGLV